MPNNNNDNQGRGGDRASHEQHVKAGQQSHQGSDNDTRRASGGSENGSTSERGGSHEQHVRAGQQSHKND